MLMQTRHISPSAVSVKWFTPSQQTQCGRRSVVVPLIFSGGVWCVLITAPDLVDRTY